MINIGDTVYLKNYKKEPVGKVTGFSTDEKGKFAFVVNDIGKWASFYVENLEVAEDGKSNDSTL